MPRRVTIIALLLVSLASTRPVSSSGRPAATGVSPLAAWSVQLDQATGAGPWLGKATVRSLERYHDRMDEHVEEWTWELDPSEAVYARRLVVQARDVEQREVGIAELLAAVVDGRLLEWTLLRGETPQHVSAASMDGERWRTERANPVLGRFLDGWILSDGDLRLDQLVQLELGASGVVQQPRRVTLNEGFECNRFTGENGRGEWEVDLADDGRLLGFRIRKSSRHLAVGKPLAELSGYTSPSGRSDASIVSMTVRVERSRPSADASDSGRWFETIVFSDGGESETEVLVERHRPPNSEQSVRARCLATLPDGTPLTINAQDPDPLPREYRDGQVLIRDDEATRSRIAAAVDAATRQSAGGARPSAWWAWMLLIIAVVLVAMIWAWRRGTTRSATLLLATTVVAASPSHAAPVRPLCGIESVYATAKALDHDVSMLELLDRRFVGSLHGSSEQELLDAVRSIRLGGRLARLVPADLDAAVLPAILHVRGDPISPEFNHWVCVVGFDGRELSVINSTRLERWSLGELAARWSGVALLVGRTEPPRPSRHAWFKWVLVAVPSATAVVILLRAISPASGTGMLASARAVVVIALSAVALGVVSDLVRNDGLLAQRTTRELLRRFHLSNYIPPAAIDDLDASTERVIIDARHVADYRVGHVPGAVNIPPNATDHEFQQALHGVPPDAPIVIYCQSRGCSFARSLAARLDQAGYSRLSVFDPGWDEYAARTLRHARQDRRS